MSRLGRGFPNNVLMRQIPRRLPVIYDATGAGGNLLAATGTVSWAHTISGSAVVVALSLQATTTAATATAKVGTTTMTQLVASTQFTAAGYYVSSVLFGLINPPTGSQTVSVTSTNCHDLMANSLSYKNVTGFGMAVANSSASSAPALSVSSAPLQMAVEMFNTWSTNPSGYTQTSRYSLNVNAPSRGFLIGDAPGASPTVSFSANACDLWSAAAVPLL